MTLEELYKIIIQRKEKLPKDSYIASLFRKGRDSIIKKVGEEAVEVVIAAKNRNKNRVISEMADLWFHELILMAERDIKISDILDELKRRNQEKKKSANFLRENASKK